MCACKWSQKETVECRLLPNQTPLETVFLVWLAPRVDTGEVHVNLFFLFFHANFANTWEYAGSTTMDAKNE